MVVVPVILTVIIGGVMREGAVVARCVGGVRIGAHRLGGGPPTPFWQTSPPMGSP
jgi:hypothetical protein